MKRVELGCKGHFIAAWNCHWHRHTEANGYRISTLGEYYSIHPAVHKSIGPGSKDYFETMVFSLSRKSNRDSEGCGCHEVASWSELDCARYATAGAAAKGHEAMIRKYLKRKAGWQ